MKSELARYFKRTIVKRTSVYDRRDLCLAGLWLHAWHMNDTGDVRVTRTKFASARAAKLDFARRVRALVADGYEAHDKASLGWSINPRGMRGYYRGDGTWGWPQKWDAKVTVEVVDASSRTKPTRRRARSTRRASTAR